jgi:hypothetical protein
MVSRFENTKELTILRGLELAPSWFTKVNSIDNAGSLLLDICKKLNVRNICVLTGDPASNEPNWQIKLSSSRNIEFEDILPLGCLSQILDEELSKGNLRITQISRNDDGAEGRFIFVMTGNASPEQIVFVFECENEISFSNLAVLRFLADILYENFIENDIVLNNTNQLERLLSPIEFDNHPVDRMAQKPAEDVVKALQAARNNLIGNFEELGETIPVGQALGDLMVKDILIVSSILFWPVVIYWLW